MAEPVRRPVASRGAVRARSPETDTNGSAKNKLPVDKPAAEKYPWSPASMVADKQGLNLMIFAMPGAGKTTLAASANDSPLGDPELIVNFDCENRSISDRDDIMVWPGVDLGGQIESWRQFDAFNTRLVRKNPFKTIVFDTVSSGYNYAYREIIGKSSARRDGRQEFGDANQLIIDLVAEWANLSREQGINVIFTCHAEEKQEGENGPINLRPSVTPGVVKGMYQRVSTIGFLEENRQGKRKLILHNTVKVVAKHHQPRSGNSLPLEIPDPNMGRIIDHIKGKQSYKIAE